MIYLLRRVISRSYVRLPQAIVSVWIKLATPNNSISILACCLTPHHQVRFTTANDRSQDTVAGSRVLRDSPSTWSNHSRCDTSGHDRYASAMSWPTWIEWQHWHQVQKVNLGIVGMVWTIGYHDITYWRMGVISKTYSVSQQYIAVSPMSHDAHHCQTHI